MYENRNLEVRAMRRHDIPVEIPMWIGIENLPTCKICGHIKCKHGVERT